MYSYQKSSSGGGEYSSDDRVYIRCFYHRYAANLEDDSDGLFEVDDTVLLDANIFCRYIDPQSGVLSPILDGILIVRMQDTTRYLMKQIKDAQSKKRISSPIEYMELDCALTKVDKSGSLADNVWLTNVCCSYNRYVAVEPKATPKIEVVWKPTKDVIKSEFAVIATSELKNENFVLEPLSVTVEVDTAVQSKSPANSININAQPMVKNHTDELTVSSVSPIVDPSRDSVARSIEQLNPILDRLLQKHQHLVNLQEMVSLKAEKTENSVVQSGDSNPKDTFVQCEIDINVGSLEYCVVKRDEMFGDTRGGHYKISEDSGSYMNWKTFLDILSTVDTSKRINIPLTIFPEFVGDVTGDGPVSPPRGNLLSPAYSMFYATREGTIMKSTGVDAEDVLKHIMNGHASVNGFANAKALPMSSMVANICSYDKKYDQSLYINKHYIIPDINRETSPGFPSMTVTTVVPFVRRDTLSLAEYTSASLGISHKKVFEVIDNVDLKQVKLWKQLLFARPKASAAGAAGERFTPGKHFVQGTSYTMERENPTYRYMCYYDCKQNLTADLVASSQSKRKRNINISKIDTVFLECRNFVSNEIVGTFTTSISDLNSDSRTPSSTTSTGDNLLFDAVLKTRVFDVLLEIISIFCSSSSRSIGQGRSPSYVLTNFALELVMCDTWTCWKLLMI